MSYYSVPADFREETIKKYVQLNKEYKDKVNETYGQLNCLDNFLGSGRSSDHIPYCDYKLLERYINIANQCGIGFNYVLNTTCLSNEEFNTEGIKKIITFLKSLINIGVNTITVCLPSLMELIVMSGLPLKIRASTVCNIINVEKAKAFLRLGANRIVADESINRDFTELKNINSACLGDLELIVNVICNKNCIYRPFHHNQMSHNLNFNKSSVSYYSHRCMMKRCEEADNLLKMNFIRPEDIHYYENIGIKQFKIQGRQAAIKGDIPKTVEAYFKRSYEGDLLDLLDCFYPTNSFRVQLDNKKLDKFIEPFYYKNVCKNNCVECNYCNSFLDNCVNIQKLHMVNKLSLDFYKSTDAFNNNITNIMENN